MSKHYATVTATTAHHHCHEQTKTTIDSNHEHSSDSTNPSCDFVEVQCGMPQSHTGSMGQHCSRVELVTTVIVDHHSPNPADDQAHCFPNVLQSDREYSSAASASEEKVEQIDLRLLPNQQVRAFAHSGPALHVCLIPPTLLLHI